LPLFSSSSYVKALCASVTVNQGASTVLNEITNDPKVTIKHVLQALKYGADVSWTNPTNGRTAIHNLAEHNQHNILKLLTNIKKASFQVKDNMGLTPLMVVCKSEPSSNADKTVKALLRRRDVGIDELDYCGHSALYYAWEKKNIQVVKRLLLAKASVYCCIREFAEEIPLMFELLTFLEKNLGSDISQPISSLSTLTKPKSLQSFFSATVLHAEMVDYYSARSAFLSLQAMVSRNARQLVDGMVLFGLREELRSMKKFSLPGLIRARQVEEVVLEMDVEEDFKAAVVISQQRRHEVKQMKLQQSKLKRKLKDDEERETKRRTEMDRIDKLFDPR
jgi:hypothetical protein